MDFKIIMVEITQKILMIQFNENRAVCIHLLKYGFIFRIPRILFNSLFYTTICTFISKSVFSKKLFIVLSLCKSFVHLAARGELYIQNL